MDVEYVRIWQAPETYEVKNWYTLSNYANPSRYMMVGEGNTLTTAEITDASQITGNIIFGLVPSESGGTYGIQPYTGNWVGCVADANKPVPLSRSPYPYYMLKDATKGVAFDYNKNTAPITFADGSRALSLNTSRNNAVTISGTSKNASWWTMQDANEIVTGINALPATPSVATPRKVIRDGRIMIQAGEKLYTPVGIRMK